MTDGATRIVVMGVAGAGKTSVAGAIADRLGIRMVDADDVHPPANIAKMAAGTPLTDADRTPWLERLRDELAAPGGVVVTCSALARRHRDVLRGAGSVRFVFLDVSPAVAERRVGARTGHFMPSTLVGDQFATLDRPVDEPDVYTIDAGADLNVVVGTAIGVFDVN